MLGHLLEAYMLSFLWLFIRGSRTLRQHLQLRLRTYIKAVRPHRMHDNSVTSPHLLSTALVSFHRRESG